MPTLIAELARAKTELNRWSATAVDAELDQLDNRLEQLQTMKATNDILRSRLTREAATATQNVADEVDAIKQLWASTTGVLGKGMSQQEEESALQAFIELVVSCRDYLESVHRMWELLQRVGGPSVQAEMLDVVRQTLGHVQTEANRALHARTTVWHPADPARFDRGRQEITEGKGIGPDAARARFRTTPS